ncbi:RraA family protein [Ideonella sp. DXS29W]|uniref:Putative 4-hydroxy-4-methyl-2-oxoglutarate aldolase n=1 Tax=Ideonella lacteola TaxID=2984193 RepID=A0ABU9BVK5_9BURK
MRQAAQAPELIREIERVDQRLVEQAGRYAASILADVAGRRGALSGRIAPLAPKMRMAGPAVTVEVRPGDNLMIHAALALVKPGDVLVVDGKGDLSSALMGEIMCRQAMVLGVSGVVIDGAVRDSEAIRELGIPVYAAGLNPNGPTKSVPGRVNHPISVGGVSVCPGDLVVGDADGVTVIERGKVAALLPLAAEKLVAEARRMVEVQDPRTCRPAWLEGALRAAGVLNEGDAL